VEVVPVVIMSSVICLQSKCLKGDEFLCCEPCFVQYLYLLLLSDGTEMPSKTTQCTCGPCVGLDWAGQGDDLAWLSMCGYLLGSSRLTAYVSFGHYILLEKRVEPK